MTPPSSSSHPSAPDAISGSAATSGERRPRIRLLYLLPLVVFAALALLFLFRLYSDDPSKVPSALIGRPVPAFTLAPLENLTEGGQAVPGLSDTDLKGGVTIVNIWASWCAPCRQEHPTLLELAKSPATRVVGINYKDNPENARQFLGTLGNPFAAVGVDSTGRAAFDWGVYGVPETFIVGPDGIIRHKHIGPLLPEMLPGFRAKIEAARRS
jgi:cytochrome c biogenesis protein CcmG, thiol:disulfide interchange protein DsbE